MAFSKKNIFLKTNIFTVVFAVGFFFFSLIPSVNAATCAQNTSDYPGICKLLSTGGCTNRATESPDNTFTCGTGQICCLQIGSTLRDCASFPTAQLITASSCPANLPISENTGDAVGGKICCRPDPATFVQSCGNGGTCVAVGTCSGRVTDAGVAACPGSAAANKTACCIPSTATNTCASPNSCLDACATGQTRVTGQECVGVASGRVCCSPASTTATVTAPPVASVPQTITFTNPLAFNTVEQVLGSILGTLRGIIVILALVFIVIGAVLYITSAGNEGQMTLAKGAITAALIGLALGIAAPSFLKEIGNVLGWNGVNAGAAANALTLSQIARNVLNFLLSIVGILGIIMLVIGGIMYLTAAGNEDRIDSGKKIVTYSIIGIIVALASLVIVAQIAVFFG